MPDLNIVYAAMFGIMAQSLENMTRMILIYESTRHDLSLHVFHVNKGFGVSKSLTITADNYKMWDRPPHNVFNFQLSKTNLRCQHKCIHVVFKILYDNPLIEISEKFSSKRKQLLNKAVGKLINRPHQMSQ